MSCKLLTEPFKMVITFEIQNISQAEKFNRTCGHTGFARIPLVVSLGDSLRTQAQANQMRIFQDTQPCTVAVKIDILKN